jgi:outer membrane protein assembly factor BamB
MWNTPAGKQIVVAGHARLIGYDLQSGAEKWYVNGIPSGCCASPVAADGLLYFAGYAPGGPEDDFQMPKYDDLLKGIDKDKDGAISKEETKMTMLEDFFDNQDANKDGKLTREEWNDLLKFMSEGDSSAFAVKAGGAGDVTKSHVLWKSKKGLPYISSALVYRGQYVMAKDGGMLSAYDVKTGKPIYLQKRVLAEGGSFYASPVAANGHIYFTALDDGAISVIKAGSEKAEIAAANPPLGERAGATPAIADDTLYVRTAGHLYAFAEKK